MGLFNKKAAAKSAIVNLAGGAAHASSPRLALASQLLISFVQDQFYRSVSQQMTDLEKLIGQVEPDFAAKAAIYARNEFGMRSITHVLAAQLASRAAGQVWSKNFYNRVVRRPDDMLEIAALTKAKGAKMLPNAMKKGFAAAFDRFDAYQLAKYRGEGRDFKMIDLVNLVHPVPTERNAEALRLLVAGELKNTATWEAKLTAAGQPATDETEKMKMKSEAWAELLRSGKLGYLALLRNLRNILEQAYELAPEVAERLRQREQIRKALIMPFQFLVAMDAISELPQIGEVRLVQMALTDALEMSLDNVPRFAGRTLVVADDSGSMTTSVRSGGIGNRNCLQLGATFAAALFKSNDADLMRFSDDAAFIRANPRDSMMSIAEQITRNAKAGGTNFHAIFREAKTKYDRIIILSDMQGWMEFGTPTGEFLKYKTRTGASPFIYSFDLAGYGSLQFPERQVFCLAGFSDKVFDLMKMLESDREALVNAIAAVRLD